MNKRHNTSFLLEGKCQEVTERQSVFPLQSERVGFTLAEVLITLGIIGVVAAMTMPTLIQKNNNRVV